MKKIIKIFLIAAIAITIVIIGLNLLLNKKNTSKISSNVYKPTQIEDWRINDINTYEYIFSEIISQFNDGYLDDRLWITDNFRKNYNIDDYGIYLSRVGAPDEEWYREDDSTGEITAFSDNTQDLLDKGKIIFYTRKRENGKLSSENKYTFSFEIDKDGKLDKLTVQDKIKTKDYIKQMINNNNMFYNLSKDIFVNHNSNFSKYDKYFDDNIDYINEIKNILVKYPNLKNISLRNSTSTDRRVVFYAEVNDANHTKIGFAIVYTLLNDKINSIRSNWLIEIDEDEYNRDDVPEDVTW